MINLHEIAFVKITGEPVFVIEVSDNYPDMLRVRRQQKTELAGLSYIEDLFYADELETLEEAVIREAAEMERRQKAYEAVMATNKPNKPSMGVN